MTGQEAIKELNEIAFNLFNDENTKNERHEEALNIAMDSLEKQIPKVPEWVGKFIGVYHCPKCGCVISAKQNYCDICGQKIDWRETA